MTASVGETRGISIEDVQGRPAEIDLQMDPKKYGLGVCPHCNGYGSSLKEEPDTCTFCSGEGLVRIKRAAAYRALGGERQLRWAIEWDEG